MIFMNFLSYGFKDLYFLENFILLIKFKNRNFNNYLYFYYKLILYNKLDDMLY